MNTTQPVKPTASRRNRRVLFVFGPLTLAVGVMFTYKLYEFLDDLTSDAGIHFAGPHLLNYMLIAVGFILLLATAFFRGHFSKIEQPKYDMLEQEERYDRERNQGL